MGTYEDLKNAIADVIYTNGNNEITGIVLQQILQRVVSTIGIYATFAGIATPDTDPGEIDQNVIYLASEPGIYDNFNGQNITSGIGIFSNKNGVWEYMDLGLQTDLSKSVTYAEILTLRNNAKLTPGMLYRITDYVTLSSQLSVESAVHLFDIIVLALSASELSEQAWATQSARDTEGYFTNSKLSAWKIWYCLDNDVSRFAWATDISEGGTGVIYRMIDEFGNDCPYDFKNITFRNPSDSSDLKEYYTFSVLVGGNMKDHSLNGSRCYENKMAPCLQRNKQILNQNIFINTYENSSCYANTFGSNCQSNTFGSNCYGNSLGEDCYSNTFGDGNFGNSFGYGCQSNTFGSNCYGNSFGHECAYNTLHTNCYGNSFGNECGDNILGEYCASNSFGNECGNNILGEYCASNSFGNNCGNNNLSQDCFSNSFENECRINDLGYRCLHNSFGNTCNNNSLGEACASNSFGNECGNNTFGDNCLYNSFGDHCRTNTFGIECQSNTFGNNCASNSFGNNCTSNSFGNNCTSNNFGIFCRYNKVDDGVYVTLSNSQSAAPNMQVQNYHFTRGLGMRTIEVERNRSCETTVAIDSSGNVKQFCIADIIL